MICFDTEDFITPEAMDAQLWWSESLHRRNIRGSFQCVGEMIRCWQENNRDDIIESIGRHEVGYHTNYHSLHPVHPEGVDPLSFADGIEWVRQRERSGLESFRNCFERNPVSYVSAGDSWTPATLLHMAEEGILVSIDWGYLGRAYYCGLLFHGYEMCIDRYYEIENPAEALQKFISDFQEHAESGQLCTIFSHPTRLVTQHFWDVVLFNGKHVPTQDIPAATLHSPGKIESNKQLCNEILDYLQGRGDINFIDNQQFYDQQSNHRNLQTLFDDKNVDNICDLPLIENNDAPTYKWGWPLYPNDFKAENITKQARELWWTREEV